MLAGSHSDSPQTFASGPGPGSGRECWRHVTVWAAASLKSLSAGAAAAESPLFASRHLPAGGEANRGSDRVETGWRRKQNTSCLLNVATV